MFVVNLTEMNVIPGVELVLWKYILLKIYVRFSLHVENKSKETVFLQPLYCGAVVQILLTCESNKLHLL